MTDARLTGAGRNRLRKGLSLLFCGCLLGACSQSPSPMAEAEGGRDISERADALLRQACDALAASKAYSCSAEVWEDVVLPGTNHKMQRSRVVEVKVRRPDRLQARQATADSVKQIFYDGKSLAIFTPADNLYGRVAAPASIEETLDFVTSTYGVTFPLEDILVADPYGSATKDVRIGRYLGRDITQGVTCHHLGFSQPTIDWQVWIEEGASPLIRKLVITYKTDPGSPQITAMFTGWNLSATFADAAFVFTPPAGAAQVEMLPHNIPSDQ